MQVQVQSTNIAMALSAEHLRVLSQSGTEWLQVSQDSKAHKQHHQHDGELEVCEGGRRNLGGNAS